MTNKEHAELVKELQKKIIDHEIFNNNQISLNLYKLNKINKKYHKTTRSLLIFSWVLFVYSVGLTYWCLII